MRVQDNTTWQYYEDLKHRLRDAGCIGCANEIYKLQLKLESELMRPEFNLNKKIEELNELAERLKFVNDEITSYLWSNK